MSYFVPEAYALFRRGYDTLEIANLLQRDEPSVLAEINIARSAIRKLPLPYLNPPYSAQCLATSLRDGPEIVRSLVPYAGKEANL
jgi:hypothetical protein